MALPDLSRLPSHQARTPRTIAAGHAPLVVPGRRSAVSTAPNRWQRVDANAPLAPDGWRPLHVASYHDARLCLDELLRRGAVVFAEFVPNGSVAVHFAAEGGAAGTLKVLLDDCMVRAARSCHRACVLRVVCANPRVVPAVAAGVARHAKLEGQICTALCSAGWCADSRSAS